APVFGQVEGGTSKSSRADQPRLQSGTVALTARPTVRLVTSDRQIRVDATLRVMTVPNNCYLSDRVLKQISCLTLQTDHVDAMVLIRNERVTARVDQHVLALGYKL